MPTLKPNAPIAINYPHVRYDSLGHQHEMELEARRELGQYLGEAIIQDLADSSPEDVTFYGFRGLRKHKDFDYNLNYSYCTLSTVAVEVRQTHLPGNVLHLTTTGGKDTTFLMEEIVNLRKDSYILEKQYAILREEKAAGDAALASVREGISILRQELTKTKELWYHKVARQHERWASELGLLLRYPVAYMQYEVNPDRMYL